MGALAAGVDDDATAAAGGGVGDARVARGGGADGLGGMEGWIFFLIDCGTDCGWG